MRWIVERVHFSLHWGRRRRAPNELPNVGLGNVPKGVSPSLGRGVYRFTCVLFWLQMCGKRNAWSKEFSF